VKETGWKERALILSTFRIAKRTISPTWSLFTPLTTVMTSVASIPAAFIASRAASFTS